MEQNQKLIGSIVSVFKDHLEHKMSESSIKRPQDIVNRMKNKLSDEKIKQINKIMFDVFNQIAQEIYDQCKDSTIDNLNKETSALIQGLFSEDETQEINNFLNTSVGRKFYRNLDLLRECYTNGVQDLTIKQSEAFTSPETLLKVQMKIEELYREDKDDE